MHFYHLQRDVHKTIHIKRLIEKSLTTQLKHFSESFKTTIFPIVCRHDSMGKLMTACFITILLV